MFCVAALLLITAGNKAALADLTSPKVYADAPTVFKSTLDVTAFSPATFAFDSANWKVSVRNDFIGSEFIPNGFEIKAQHSVAPHAGEAAPNPNTLQFNFNAGSVPGDRTVGPFTVSASHGEGHVDFLQGAFVPAGSGRSRLIIQLTHTTGQPPPEPDLDPNPFSPRLMVESSGGHAVALDSVTAVRDPFPFVALHNFSPDQRTRVSLFARNLELKPGEDASVVTAQAETSHGVIIPLPVEFVGTVPGFDWLTQIIVRIPDELSGGGDVSVSIAARGEVSNKALITIEPSANNSP